MTLNFALLEFLKIKYIIFIIIITKINLSLGNNLKNQTQMMSVFKQKIFNAENKNISLRFVSVSNFGVVRINFTDSIHGPSEGRSEMK